MDYYSLDNTESTGMEIEVQWQATQSSGNAAWDKLLKDAKARRTTDYGALDATASSSKQNITSDADSLSSLSFFAGSSASTWAANSPDRPRVPRPAGRVPTRSRARRTEPSDPEVLNNILQDLNRLVSAEEARAASYAKSLLSAGENSSVAVGGRAAAATEPVSVAPLEDGNAKGKGKGKEKAYSLLQVMDMSMDVSMADIRQDSDSSTILDLGRPESQSSTTFSSPRARSVSTSTRHAPTTDSSRGKLQRHTSHPCSSSMFATPSDNEDSPQQSHLRRTPSVTEIRREPQPVTRRPSAAAIPPKPIVRMHPLLVQQSQAQAQAQERSSSVQKAADHAHLGARPLSRTTSTSRVHSSSTRAPATATHRGPARSSSTSYSRAPPLGMRRTHTYPSTPFQPQRGSSQNFVTRQRGFKPPLGGAGTQLRRRAADPERLKAIEQGIREAQATQQVYSQLQQQQQHRAPSGSQGSTESCSSNASSENKSISPISKASHVEEARKEVEQKELEEDDMDADILLCEGADPDSSFGEISLDMDVFALEETMKMYD